MGDAVISFISPTLPGTVLGTGNTQSEQDRLNFRCVEIYAKQKTGTSSYKILPSCRKRQGGNGAQVSSLNGT